MTNGLIGLLAVVMMLACFKYASGRSLGHVVTKETQLKEGLEFSLTAVRENADAVVVRVAIPRKGKLQTLQRVRLSIRDGNRILLLAPLETREEAGSIVTGFQISPSLADQSHVELVTETGRAESFYMVRLKEYVSAR